VFPLAGTLVVLVLHSTPAAATRPRLLPVLYLTQATLQALDLHSTLQALEHGNTREANPLVRRMAGTPSALLAVKVAGVTSTILLSEYLWKHGHRRTAVITLALVNTATAIAVAHNYALAH
jgi:hypothetical protein